MNKGAGAGMGVRGGMSTPQTAKEAYRAGSKKFSAGENPLELERKLDVIMPLEANQLKATIALLDKEYAGASDSQRAALDMWKMQISQMTAGDTVRLQFLRRFYFWLLGRGTEEDTKKTLWGRGNAAANNPEVAAYIDQFQSKRTQYALLLFSLSQRVPNTLNGYYLYFKYIVNGNLEYKKLSDGTGFYDLSNEDYLADFDVFQRAFGNGDGTAYAPMYAPGGSRGNAPAFRGGEPFPATYDERKEHRLRGEDMEENAVAHLRRNAGIGGSSPATSKNTGTGGGGLTQAQIDDLKGAIREGLAAGRAADDRPEGGGRSTGDRAEGDAGAVEAELAGLEARAAQLQLQLAQQQAANLQQLQLFSQQMQQQQAGAFERYHRATAESVQQLSQQLRDIEAIRQRDESIRRREQPPPDAGAAASAVQVAETKAREELGKHTASLEAELRRMGEEIKNVLGREATAQKAALQEQRRAVEATEALRVARGDAQRALDEIEKRRLADKAEMQAHLLRQKAEMEAKADQALKDRLEAMRQSAAAQPVQVDPHKVERDIAHAVKTELEKSKILNDLKRVTTQQISPEAKAELVAAGVAAAEARAAHQAEQVEAANAQRLRKMKEQVATSEFKAMSAADDADIAAQKVRDAEAKLQFAEAAQREEMLRAQAMEQQMREESDRALEAAAKTARKEAKRVAKEQRAIAEEARNLRNEMRETAKLLPMYKALAAEPAPAEEVREAPVPPAVVMQPGIEREVERVAEGLQPTDKSEDERKRERSGDTERTPTEVSDTPLGEVAKELALEAIDQAEAISRRHTRMEDAEPAMAPEKEEHSDTEPLINERYFAQLEVISEVIKQQNARDKLAVLPDAPKREIFQEEEQKEEKSKQRKKQRSAEPALVA